jgi:WD40 repeat protein
MSSERTISAARLGAIAGLALMLLGCQDSSLSNYAKSDALPKINPDYSGIVIPPNIAPLNFVIEEVGSEYYVEIYGSKTEKPIGVRAESNTIRIAMAAWKELLAANAGGELFLDIYVKDEEGEWTRFRSIVNEISVEEIDSHVSYRLINPGYVLWWEMGIYQRNVEDFTQSAIFSNRATGRNCMNCHTVCWNDPKRTMFHMRAGYGGTVISRDGQISKVDTRTKYTMSAGVYPAWHPGGKHIAFSVNKISQSFHNEPGRSLHVWDNASDLMVYEIETRTITTSPRVSTKRLENLPAWSPDGHYLYFCRGPERGEHTQYDEYSYDLCRIRYDVDTREWGEVEDVIGAEELGKSISFPRISPDGARLLFSGSDFGYFSIHFASSDLYLLDLSSGEYGRLEEANSKQSDSYHSWSSNSRWFVFASKRRGGLCSRLYFSYVDSLGNAHKPFVLPQEDPRFYDTFVKNYNVPELMTGAVSMDQWELLQVARGESIKAEFDEAVDIDALSGATRIPAE